MGSIRDLFVAGNSRHHRSRKARGLAVMAAERNSAFKDVPTLKEAMDIDYTTGAWRGFAAPKGTARRTSPVL